MPPASRIAIRLQLSSGPASIPLLRVHQVAPYATLTGTPDDYFLGWLTFHGHPVPVFDLNRVVCDQPTAETFGTRILLVESAPGISQPLVGLLAAGLTDTISGTPDPAIQAIELDLYLAMLYPFIPEPPTAVAA